MGREMSNGCSSRLVPVVVWGGGEAAGRRRGGDGPWRGREWEERGRGADELDRQVFKKTAYKGQQEEIMQAALRGSDILVIAPTGMGKSLCFQVPAIADEHGLTLVVSPLLCEPALLFL